MKRKEVWAVFFAVMIIISLQYASAASAELSDFVLKASVKQGERLTKNLKVGGSESGEFNLRVVSAQGVKLKERTFSLEENQEKNVEVIFDAVGVGTGVYIGVIEIIGPEDALNVPVIFEVESEDVFFDVNIDIPPVYIEITPGAKLVYQAKIFDLTAGGGLQEGLGPVTIDIEYIVSGLDGSVLLTKNEQQIVDKQSQITNTISFPEEVARGAYVLSAIAKYKTSVGISSQTFEIRDEEKSGGLGINFSDYTILIVIGFAMILFFFVIFLFVYLLRERDKVLVELRKYNTEEIRQVRELLKEQQEILRERRPAAGRMPKSAVIDSLVKKEVDEKISKLKKKQAERIEQVRKLSKQGLSADEMKRKLEQWKKQGYNISPAEYKIKKLSTHEMKEVLKRWKKKYRTKQRKKAKPKNIKRRKNYRNMR